MKIGVFEIESWEREAFDDLSQKHELLFDERELDIDIAKEYADVDVVSVFIYSYLDAEILKHFKQLKLITTRSTGVDHIDIDYCGKHGIAVARVPDYGTHTVAEHVFALLLAISHKLIEAIERTRRGDFTQEGLTGFVLADHILLRMGNVIVTPHTAFNTTEAVERILRTTRKNITSFLEGEGQNQVIRPDE